MASAGTVSLRPRPSVFAPSTCRPRGLAAAAASAAVLATAVLAASLLAGQASAARVKVASTQKLAALLVVHQARSGPSLHARALDVVQARRPLTGERTVLPVLGRRRGPQGALWLHVRLPGRPNGHTGWIRKKGTRFAQTSWALVVDLGSRAVDVFHRGRQIRAFRAVVGQPSTPTPVGRFFVEESLRMASWAQGAPYAIALSARSNVYQEFDGGPGQIAVHGVQGIGGTPGTAVSHGCIRLATSDMAWLGARIHPGVPTIIVA